MDGLLPSWVEDELHNWARSQWEGDWPGPRRVLPAASFCAYPMLPGHIEDDEDDIPVNHDRAARLHRLYEALPHIEQRVIQAEYTREREYSGLPTLLRAHRIGVELAYYQVALDSFKRQVWRSFK